MSTTEAGTAPASSTDDDVPERVIKLVSAQYGPPIADIKPEQSLVADLNGDSLDSLELIMACEDEFDITIPDEEGPDCTTVQSVIDLVRKHAEAQHA